MTVKEVAEYLRVSTGCIYSMVSRRVLACQRVGVGRGRIRISQDDVDFYLESRRVSESKDERKPQPKPRLKFLRTRSNPPSFG